MEALPIPEPSTDTDPETKDQLIIHSKPQSRKAQNDSKKQGFLPCQYNEQIIMDNLAKLNGPMTDLLPLSQKEQQFSNSGRLYVGNLPSRITEEELKSLFQKYGKTSSIYINNEKRFGFIGLDNTANALRAKTELAGLKLKGKTIIIRDVQTFAIRVKNLSPYVSNELLRMAFSIFGEIKLAYVVVDIKGKSTGEGIIEYSKKNSVFLATKYCKDHSYFLTSSLRPVVVEKCICSNDTVGLPESTINKTTQYYRERDIGPRFAAPESFEHNYAERWKNLYENYKGKLTALESEMSHKIKILEIEMSRAHYDYKTEQLKEMLIRRERGRERFFQNWEISQRRNDQDQIQCPLIQPPTEEPFSSQRGERNQEYFSTPKRWRSPPASNYEATNKRSKY